MGIRIWEGFCRRHTTHSLPYIGNLYLPTPAQLGQHDPTHPSIHIKFAYEYMQVLTTG